MTEFIIRYDRKACIGAGVCEAFSEKHWKVANGKADLVGSTQRANGIFEKVIQESELGVNKSAAEGCPPNCIKIFVKETSEEVKLDR